MKNYRKIAFLSKARFDDFLALTFKLKEFEFIFHINSEIVG